MPACEMCWSNASHKSLMGYGFTAEIYADELRKHPEHEMGPHD